MNCIDSQNLTLSFGENIIINSLYLSIPKGKITVFVGGNGCGKSTLLRSFCRLLKPTQGKIRLNGQDIHTQSSKSVAKQLAILPQGPIAPEGLTIKQLVKQGRYPHQSWLQQWSKQDEKSVNQALEACDLTHLASRELNTLSGGQRQRAWIAMTLAQDTDTIFLDEPTTYLDMAHQIEILDLLFEMNETFQTTIVMVLHDLNLACRYAHHLIAVKDKGIYIQGAPNDVMTKEMVKSVFDMNCQIIPDPLFGTPLCIPHGRGNRVC